MNESWYALVNIEIRTLFLWVIVRTMFISFECFLVCNESFKTKIIVFIVNSSALDKNSDMKFTKLSKINSKFTNLENELEI